MLQHLINAYNQLPANAFSILLAVIGGGTSVSVVLQAIKHWKGWQDRKGLIMGLLSFLSFLPVFADWYINYSSQNPITWMGKYTTIVLGVAVLIHRVAVSPLYYKVTSFINGIYGDAKAYRAEQTPLSVAGTGDPSALAVPHEFTL